ncbi:MAG: AAA family ATPase [Actinomycetota bacterium]|nr:AAA family ATPase [Actinomycetota bacterium]
MARSGWYTNQAILDAEAQLLEAARTPVAVGISGEAFAVTVERQRDAGAQLDAGQIALARAFACDGRLVTAGIGPAGAGKTTAMRLAARAVEDDGRQVIALAPSARAAEQLGQEIGVQARTIAHVLTVLDTQGPDATGITPGNVLIVDEAGMAGTLNLDRLVAHAAQQGAVVRLLGDPMQLAAVESGGALRLIENEVGAARLHEVYRFTDPAEAAATLALRDGKTGALGYYESRGRIAGGTRDAMLDGLYQGWKTDTDAGRQSLMIASRREDVVELATRARLDRVAAGLVDLDGVGLHNGTTAGVGDMIVTRQNDRMLAVRGTRDQVKRRHVARARRRHRRVTRRRAHRAPRPDHAARRVRARSRRARLRRDRAPHPGRHRRHHPRADRRRDKPRIAVRRSDPRPRRQPAVRRHRRLPRARDGPRTGAGAYPAGGARAGAVP